MKLPSFSSKFLVGADKYLGTMTAKVVPLVVGTIGTVLSADPTQYSTATNVLLPMLHPTAHVTHLVGTGMAALAVVHALLTKSPATKAVENPVSPPAAIVAEVKSEAAEPGHTTPSEMTPAIAALIAALKAKQRAVEASSTTLSKGVTAQEQVGISLLQSLEQNNKIETSSPTKESDMSNMPSSLVPTEPVVAPAASWVADANTVAGEIESSLPILNEVLAMVTALTGKSIPGLAAGETVALAILSDVQSFSAGKASTTPPVTFTVAGVKLTASLTVQKA